MNPRHVAALLVLSSATASAHHSFALFDSSVNTTLTGVVREFQWTNPHSWIQLNVPDGKGGQVEWAIEGNSPNILVRQGFTSKTLKPGDRITVVVHPLVLLSVVDHYNRACKAAPRVPPPASLTPRR